MTAPALAPARPAPREAPPVRTALIRGPFLVWAALFLNLLTFIPLPILVPIPHSIGQLITQGALPLALLLGLLANPAVVIRPSLIMVLLSAMSIVALATSIHSEFLIGSTFRAVRLVEFVAVLWLISPWWGRRDMTLLQCHLRCLRIVLATVLIGAMLAPGKAFSYGGRLSGALWPIPPPQVAHYAAILFGCTLVLWFGGSQPGRRTAFTLAISFGLLIATHTRTALLAMIIGLLVAGASLFFGHARVRRTSATVGVTVVVIATTLGPLITKWALRGQSTQEAGQLTGRTKVWTAIEHLQRPVLNEFFGNGLSNKSFNGLPIDSNWLATFLDLGWFGISVDVMLLLSLLLLAIIHPRGPRRALALFFVAYCLVASVTETGLGDASPYLLDLVVAGSLLAPPLRAQRE